MICINDISLSEIKIKRIYWWLQGMGSLISYSFIGLIKWIVRVGSDGHYSRTYSLGSF